MTLLAANFQRMIDEQKARKEARKKKKKKGKKMKTIKVYKFNPETGQDEFIEIKTPDHGTLEEMFKKYGNDFRYFCAMYPLETHPELRLWGGRWRPYELFPDKEIAKKKLDEDLEEYTSGSYWTNLEDILEGNPHLNPLGMFSDHIAWIDLKYNCILVEKAG